MIKFPQTGHEVGLRVRSEEVECLWSILRRLQILFLEELPFNLGRRNGPNIIYFIVIVFV